MEQGIGNIVVGYNRGWKDSINIGRRNNQTFVQISYEKLIWCSGKRVKRGLFQSSVGKTINADVNGVLNILRKVVGDSETISRITDSGRLFRPVMVNIL